MNVEESIFEEKTGPSKELRVLAAACYFPFGFVLPYFLGKNGEPFVAFHLKQGLAFFFALIVSGILPIDGSFGFGIFVYLIVGGWTGYKAYQWETYMLGLIRMIADLISKSTKQ